MTTLHKAIHRATAAQYAVLHHRRFKQIVVSLVPGDVIEFREFGRRHRFSLPVDGCFKYAIRCSIEAARRAKKEAKKIGGGR